jgi:Membrane-bound metallopeptidase
MASKETMGKTGGVAGLPLPVSGKLLRGYGWSTDGLDDMERFHPGIDIAAAPGSPVKAVLPGKVAKIGEDEGLKSFILLDHGEGTYTLYAGLGNIKGFRRGSPWRRGILSVKFPVTRVLRKRAFILN